MADAVRQNRDKANLLVLLFEAEVGISPVWEFQEDGKRTWNGHHGCNGLLFRTLRGGGVKRERVCSVGFCVFSFLLERTWEKDAKSIYISPKLKEKMTGQSPTQYPYLCFSV